MKSQVTSLEHPIFCHVAITDSLRQGNHNGYHIVHLTFSVKMRPGVFFNTLALYQHEFAKVKYIMYPKCPG